MKMPRRPLAPVLFALLLSGGCYTYAPLDPARAAPGLQVRARITGTQAEQIAPLIGVTDARVLSGTIVHGGDTLIVEVPSGARIATAGVIQSLNQRVSVPRAAIVELESRTLNRGRTAAVAGVAIVVVGSYLVKALIIDPGRERSPIDPGGTELAPRFRFTF